MQILIHTFIWNRQIIAYKNLIEALEHISIAMILASGFFTNGKLSLVDYREFIRYNSLSQEHLVSAKHFLQLESIFEDDIEMKLSQWYQELPNTFIPSMYHGNYFENRHKSVNDSIVEQLQKDDYLNFMRDEVLPRILKFQQSVREDIRLGKEKNCN